MNKNEYAFPVIISNNTDIGASETGMTLRDYFANEQTAAWVIALSDRRGEPGYSDEGAIAEAVRLGNITADAMLKARQ